MGKKGMPDPPGTVRNAIFKRKRIADVGIIVLGCVIFALSYNLFMRGNHIIPGGVTGVAALISYLTGYSSTGVFIMLLNIPLFLLAFHRLGIEFLVYSLLGTLLSAALIDLLSFLPTIKTEPLIAAVFGGAISGLGIGLILARGATTGGSDIAARLLKLHFRNMPIGALSVCVNMVVVISAGLVFLDINAALYTTILEAASSYTIDKIIYGSSNATVAYIISSKETEVVNAIDQNLQRGSTLLKAVGAFTGDDRRVIFCAVKRHQVAALKSLVLNLDPMAFVIVTRAREVLGEGFDTYSDTSL